jgi:cell division protein FtsW
VSVFTAIGMLVGAGGGLLAVTEPYRLARLTGFTNPCAVAKAQDAGYQACQGLYALASGGWFGLGLGASREKFGYLPNQYTDYIFAIIGEELGLLGTLVVLVLFAVLGFAGIRIAQRCTDRFSQLAAAGVTAWLLGQALVNMGAVVGLLPITGIPLPMVSFGGSALVPTLFAIGMLASFARHEPAAARALAARRAARRRSSGRRPS